MSRGSDLVCLSHLRWGFVFQRPNHLMVRAARDHRVFFVEEPFYGDHPTDLMTEVVMDGLTVCTPQLPAGTDPDVAVALQRSLLHDFMRSRGIERPILWFYTPMAVPLAHGVEASLVVYDCMDELTGFHGAPVELVSRERALFAQADLVFTGGKRLYEAKRTLHPSVYAYPSSVDAAHYARARALQTEPDDQRDIPHPRVGYFGVIDERIDLDLLASLADARPEYHLVMVGPVVKIDEATLPRRPNLHYLGGKKYDDLPDYLGGWDVAMMPFALNDATAFISPTKTLEYLAAGRPVVSTAIRDVVDPYGEEGVVSIADAEGFPAAIDAALCTDAARHSAACDVVVARTSWDKTWRSMARRIETSFADRPSNPLRVATEREPCSTT